MLTEITLSMLVSALIIVGIWLLRGMLLTPVTYGEHQKMTVELRIDGSSPELENTVSSLIWLVDNGTLIANIMIIDDGMDEDTRLEAEILAKTNERVSFKEWRQVTDI